MAVEFKFTSSDAEVVKALEAMTRKMQALREEARRLKDESKRSSESAKEGGDIASNALMGMTKKIGPAIAGYVSLQAAARLYAKEIENINERQDKAADAQTKAADAQIKLLRNLGRVSEEEQKKFISGLKTVAKETGQSEATIYSAASSAVSAQGGFSRDAVIQSTKQAARFVREDAGEMSTAAGGLLDIGKLTKSENAKQNLGFMIAMGEKSRVESPELMAKNLVPGMIGAAGYGGTPQEAAALVDALSVASADKVGAQSKTGAIALAQQLDEFLPEHTRYRWDERGRKHPTAKGTGLTTTADRIAKIQSDPKLLERFLGSGATFEKDMLEPVKQLLTGGSETAKLYGDIKEKFPGGKELETIADEFVAGIDRDPLQQAAQANRKRGSVAENLRAGDLVSGNSSMARKRTDELLSASGASGIERFAAARAFEMSAMTGFGTSEQVSFNALKNRANSIEAGKGGKLFGSSSPEEAIDALKGILSEMQELNRKQAGTNINAHTE